MINQNTFILIMVKQGPYDDYIDDIYRYNNVNYKTKEEAEKFVLELVKDYEEKEKLNQQEQEKLKSKLLEQNQDYINRVLERIGISTDIDFDYVHSYMVCQYEEYKDLIHEAHPEYQNITFDSDPRNIWVLEI